MTALNGTRGGRTRRTRRKRHARRKQRTHRKQQFGGADEVLYFYEAYDPTGFLTNFYVNGIKDQSREGVPLDTTGMVPFMYKPSTCKDDKFVGIPFANSEQAFCYEKALFFDPTMSVECVQLLKKIVETSDPNIIKEIGSADGHNDGNRIWKIVITIEGDIWGKWAKVSRGIMKDILMAKFTPVGKNDAMLRMLKETGKSYLAEEYDMNWGIGYGEAEAEQLRRAHPEQIDARGYPFWEKANRDGKIVKCTNNLGEVLMEIRDELSL